LGGAREQAIGRNAPPTGTLFSVMQEVIVIVLSQDAGILPTTSLKAERIKIVRVMFACALPEIR